MKDTELKESSEKFRFLDDKTANEPHVYEVLNEILLYQMNSLPSGEKSLATIDILKKSGKIRIPFTTTRDRTVEYLTDILIRRYGHLVRPIVSFEFSVDESNKQININETLEYTVLLNDKDYERLLAIRDKKSAANLLDLLKKYRFFNLSKLIKRAGEKAELSRIIKNELGNKIFTFKNYNIDDNKIEWAEDFCFHVDNYESVKESLNLNTLKEIINSYYDYVKKGLNKFGILNSDFSDYRDSKLAYIFSVLTDDLAATLSEKDLVDVKNFQSLVSCLNKVDKVVDPMLVYGEDIIKYIRQHKITAETEILATLTDLSPEAFKKWATQDNLKVNKIVHFTGHDGDSHYIDGTDFFDLISEYNQLILFQPEKMDALSLTEKRKVNSSMDLLYRASLSLLNSNNKIQDYIKINNEKLQILKKILDEYDKYKSKLAMKDRYRELAKTKKKRSLFKVVIDFLKSILKLFRTEEQESLSENLSGRGVQRKELSSETAKVYRKVIDKNAPLIPLSDLVELTPENDYLVDRIISEIRGNNLKIIIPVYNARNNLYPKRSQKVLVSDMEYMLVPTDIARSPEAIREFTDSLIGHKIKDDIIPAAGIIAIEKYLLTLYRQHKSIK